VQEVDDGVGEFGSKVSERHCASEAGTPDGEQQIQTEGAFIATPNSQPDSGNGTA
jgi:hypothetical protein